MCGRFYLDTGLSDIELKYGIMVSDQDIYLKKDVFPSDNAYVIVNEGKRAIKLLKWGFKPSYMKNMLINARSETIDQKLLFKRPLLNKRCIIPVSGFYEWKKDISKTKYSIYVKEKPLISLAGLYDTFTDTKGTDFDAFTIITTAASSKMSQIHNRMPVILDTSSENVWLDSDIKDTQVLKDLLRPYEYIETEC